MKQSKIRQSIRSWLIRHPKLNPYKWSSRHGYRLITSPFRILPDFIIIGAAKCGTTSLYDYMIKHPCIFPAGHKEIHYFDFHFYSGINYYKSSFPTIFSKFIQEKIRHKKFVTGEASPLYFNYPLVPERVHKTIPKVKLIIILRNPIDRTLSHYQMQVNYGLEKLSFEEAIKSEKKRLTNEREKILSNKNYQSNNLAYYTYLSKGLYFEQLIEWRKFFPMNQFLILSLQELEISPEKTLTKVFEFLNLPDYKIKNFERLNVGNYEKMKPEIRKYLIEYFKPHNESLNKYLGTNYDWDK